MEGWKDGSKVETAARKKFDWLCSVLLFGSLKSGNSPADGTVLSTSRARSMGSLGSSQKNKRNMRSLGKPCLEVYQYFSAQSVLNIVSTEIASYRESYMS